MFVWAGRVGVVFGVQGRSPCRVRLLVVVAIPPKRFHPFGLGQRQ